MDCQLLLISKKKQLDRENVSCGFWGMHVVIFDELVKKASWKRLKLSNGQKEVRERALYTWEICSRQQE